jgi:hypothetical protein
VLQNDVFVERPEGELSNQLLLEILRPSFRGIWVHGEEVPRTNSRVSSCTMS